jgi:hypothetical protein
MSVDYYMWSSEEVDFGQVRRCRPGPRLTCISNGGENSNFQLLEIEPPLDLKKYCRSEDSAPMRHVVVTPHFTGASLFPVQEWPLPVYVCKVDNIEGNSMFRPDQVRIITWAELYPNKQSAEDAMQRHNYRANRRILDTHC